MCEPAPFLPVKDCCRGSRFGRVRPTRAGRRLTNGRDAGRTVVATGHTAAPDRLHRRGLGLRAAAALATALMTAALAGAWAPVALAAGGSISGTVRDTSGTPLSGIAVQAGTIVSGGFTVTPGASTTTAGNGTYTVSVSTTGRYAIRFVDATQAHASGYYSSSGFVPDAPRATVILV